MYWAEALAKESKDMVLKTKFSSIAQDLISSEATIIKELNSVQGNPLDIGGYYFPSVEKTIKEMRPSETLNAIMDEITSTQLA